MTTFTHAEAIRNEIRRRRIARGELEMWTTAHQQRRCQRRIFVRKYTAGTLSLRELRRSWSEDWWNRGDEDW